MPNRRQPPTNNSWPTPREQMPAVAHKTTAAAAPVLRLWTPDADAQKHRIRNPVSRSADRRTGDKWPADIDPAVAAYADQIADEIADVTVPEGDREWVRSNLTLRGFYETWMHAERLTRVQAGDLSRASMHKDRDALARWERFSRPANWPTGREWPGLPIGKISGRYLSTVLEAMRAELGDQTVRSTWNHLRTVFNHAVRLRALDAAPRPARYRLVDRDVAIFRDDQLAAGHCALANALDLQVAFVLAANAGLRPVDLFLLRWQDIDLDGETPSVAFVATKTRKRQRIPIAPVTVAQLRRLPPGEPADLVFPGRTNPDVIDPEKSAAARSRRKQVRTLLAAAGLRFEKPFQALRATCNTRLNRVREGAGVFVLGHGLTLNAKSYTEPTELVREAVLAVHQPDCFRVT